MDKIEFLNLSLWTSFMIDYLDRTQVITGTDEIKRSQYADTLPVSVNTLAVLKTKGILRAKIRPFSATWGLPKCCETYGDGDPIVSVFMQKRKYATRVMPGE
jgi:hypothetical protein